MKRETNTGRMKFTKKRRGKWKRGRGGSSKREEDIKTSGRKVQEKKTQKWVGRERKKGSGREEVERG